MVLFGGSSKIFNKAFADSAITCFENFKGRERFTIISAEDTNIVYPDGIIFSDIDKGE